MKRILIFLLLSISLMLRYSISTKRTVIQQGETHRIFLELNESRAKILKIDGKYPFQQIYARLYFKEDGKYDGYFYIENMYPSEEISFITLKEIKSEKIEKNFIEKYLENIFNRSQKNFSNSLKNMNKALLLGDSSALSNDIKVKIRYLGLSHIFAMSGLHIGLVFMIFYFICFKIFKKKIIIELATLIMLSFYYLGVKESPSFTRAYIMLLIYILAKILYEKASIEKTLFVSAIISIFIKPSVIFSLSFQLSYLAMIAIIYFYPLVKKINIKKWRILDYILYSLSIQIFLIPIQIYYFKSIPFLSIFISLILLPISSIFISISYIHLFLENFYLSFLSAPLVKCSYKIFMLLIDIFSDVPSSILVYYNEKIMYVYFLFMIIILINRILKKLKK